jgi:hypothetical protein
MTKHKLKRIYEKAGFKVGFLREESATFPALVRDLDGNRVDSSDPRWKSVLEIHQKHA